MIGETITSFRDLTLIEGDFRDRVTNAVNDINQVMNLSYTTSYYIRFGITQGSGQSQVRTITVTLGENNTSNDVNIVFNQDKSFDIQYSFQIDSLDGEEEVTQDITLVIKFAPLSYQETTNI